MKNLNKILNLALTSLVIVIISLLLLNNAPGITDAQEAIFQIQKVSTPVVVDGNLAEFSGANEVVYGTPETSNINKVKALWDNQNLYFGFQVQDSEILAHETARDGRVWEDDEVEWFIDTLADMAGSQTPSVEYVNTDDYQGVINTNNTQFDARGSQNGVINIAWNGAWQSAVSKSSSGYSVEVAIPWNTIGYASIPTAQSIIGIDFAMTDLDNSRMTWVMWPHYTDYPFQNASRWQKAQLVNTPTTSCPRKSEGDADCNGAVDLADYEIWRKEFRHEFNSKMADFHIDTAVDLIDYEVWRRTFINGPETTH